MPKSIEIQSVGARRLLDGAKRHIQGIASDIDEIKLVGESFKAVAGLTIVGEGIMLERTIETASTLTIPVEDRDGRLLRSRLLEAPFEVRLDGLRFVFTALRQEGDVLTMTFEPRNVYRLRRERGAVKVFRGRWTRQEFYASLVKDAAGAEIPLFTPDLHKRRPIEDAKDAKEDGVERDVVRGKGVNDDPEVSSKGSGGLTVKGVPADQEQLANGDTSLRVAETLNAPVNAQIALIAAEIAESLMRNVTGGLDSSVGILQLLDIHGSVEFRRNIPKVVELFLQEGFTGAGGAIALAKRGMDPAQIAATVQGNAAGTASYSPYVDEARKWVEFFAGGKLEGGAAGGEEGTVTKTVRYAFERKADESTWACGARLAEEVNFRHFESAGIIYFVAEPRLLESKVRMRLDRDTPGLVAGLNFEYDPGRRVNEISFNAYTRAWAAPPGTVVQVEGHGPANGRYLVSSIRSKLRGLDVVEITARRASPPHPEPAAETTTKSVERTDEGSSGEASGALQKMIDEADRMTKLGQPYLWGGGHGSTTSASGPWDCSGAVSRVLAVGGFLETPLTTYGLDTWGEPGEGKDVTVYIRGGGTDSAHTIMRIDGRLFGTGGENSGGGAGWLDSTTDSYVATLPIHRHPKGL